MGIFGFPGRRFLVSLITAACYARGSFGSLNLLSVDSIVSTFLFELIVCRSDTRYAFFFKNLFGYFLTTNSFYLLVLLLL